MNRQKSIMITAIVTMLLGIYTVAGWVSFTYASSLPLNDKEIANIQKTTREAKRSLLPAANAPGGNADESKEVNLINFPDPNFLNKVLSLPEAQDRLLTKEEIAGITSLDVSSGAITNLKGIEIFTALKSLNCSKNTIEELDFTANTKLETLNCAKSSVKTLNLSENTMLKELNCGENLFVTLDLFKNTALTSLNVNKNTTLTTLDLSQNTALTALDCAEMKLQALDVSLNTALKRLNCAGSYLTALDVSKNRLLTDLICGANNLKKLDVSQNTQLTVLWCQRNQLQKLDTSKNTKLVHLNCEGNQLLSLNLSENTDLSNLKCGDNQLQTLEITQNNKLSEVSCENNRLRQLIGPDIPSMNSLNCANNQLICLDLKNCAVNTLNFSGQQYTIGAGSDCNLSDLAPHIVNDRITNLRGATSTGTVLKNLTAGTDVTYDYTYGGGKTMPVTLKVVEEENQWKTAPPVKIDDWTYGETPSEPEAEAEKGTVEYAYSAYENGPYTKEKPTTAGDWFVKAFVTATADYAGLESNAVPFKIERITVSFINEPQNLTCKYKDKLKDIELLPGWRWTAPETELLTIGNHEYGAVLDIDEDNYDYSLIPEYIPGQGTVTRKLRVNIEQATNDWIGGDPTIADWTYKEGASTPNAKAKFGEVKLTYKNNNGGNYAETMPTEPGSYTMRAFVEGTNNYTGLDTDVAPELPVLFTIKKATPQYTVPSGLTATFGQSLEDIKERLMGVAPALTGFSWMNPSPADEKVGEVGVQMHKAKYTSTTDDPNKYETVENIDVPVMVGKATNEWSHELAISKNEWQYGDTTPGQPTATAKFGNENLKFIYRSQDGSDGDYTTTAPVKVGKWQVKAVVEGTENYTGLTTETPVKFEIKRAPVLNVDSPADLTGIPKSDLSDIKLSGGWKWVRNATLPDTIGTEEYSAELKVDDENYDYSRISDYIDGKVTRLLSVEVAVGINQWLVSPSINGWDYNSTPISEPQGDAKYGEVEFSYCDDKDGTYTERMPEKANAGTWYLKAEVAAEAGRFNGLTDIQPFTIKKAQFPFDKPTNLTATYGQTLSEVKLPKGFSWEDGTKQIKAAGQKEYAAKYTPEDLVNYVISDDIMIPITVKTMADAWKTPLAITGWTYGQTANSPVAESISGRTPEFVYSKTKDGTYTSAGPAGAGIWHVKAIVPEDDIYARLESSPVEFTILRGTAPAVDEPKNLTGTPGQALSTVILPTGWKWVTPGQIIGVTSNTYNAMLTVEDENYEYGAVPGYDSTAHAVRRSLNVKTSTEQNLWTTPPSIKDWVYGQPASTPAGVAQYGTVAFTYGNAQAGPFTATVPTKAGTWYMKAAVAAASGYTELTETLKFTIEKATPTYIVPTGLSATYGDALSTITLPTGFSWMDGTKTVGTAGNQIHKAKYTPTDAENYATAENLDVTVAVKKATNAWKAELTAAGWIYGDTNGAPAATAAFGDIAYTYSNKTDGTYAAKKPVNAGTWYVKAEVKETDNYTGIKAGPVEFTIEQKSSDSLTIPEIDQNTDLDTLEIKDGDKVLEKGKDYDITKKKSGNKVTVTIKFKGNYKGTVTKTYTTDSGSSGNTGGTDNGNGNGNTSGGSGSDSGSGNASGSGSDSGNSGSDSNASGSDSKTVAEDLAKLNESIKKGIADLAVATGDAANLKPWLLVLVASLIVVLIAAKRPRKKKK